MAFYEVLIIFIQQLYWMMEIVDVYRLQISQKIILFNNYLFILFVFSCFDFKENVKISKCYRSCKKKSQSINDDDFDAFIKVLVFKFLQIDVFVILPSNHYKDLKMRNFLILFLISSAIGELYSLNKEFEVSPKTSPDELAHAIYEKTERQTGWNQLYIYTNPQATPLQQHQAAGYLQGYATYRQIYDAYLNYIGLDFGGNRYAPKKVDDFMQDQVVYMDEMVRTHPDDIFWTYVGYYLAQVRYMHAGYMARVKKEKISGLDLQFKQYYYLTSIGDLEDLLYIDDQNWERKNCNAYVRLQGEDLTIAHNTHNRYSLMIRIFKTWNFPRNGVAMQSVSFSSRPGDLISKDDFFLLSSGLRVLETSLNNFDKSNLNEVKYTTAPSWIRTVVANHLSNNPQEWISYFNTSRSGTHNNQWIIVDSKRIGKTQGVVLFFEEAFSLCAKIDMTSQLLQRGYVAGYNMAITIQIYHKLGLNETRDTTYLNDPRAKIFEEIHPLMKTIDDMKYYLTRNEEGYCEGLAPRCDLVKGGSPFGLTDCKIATMDMLRHNYVWAISGPSTSGNRLPPFKWKDWSSYPHEGLAEVYDFEWQKIILDAQQSYNSQNLRQE